MLENFKSSMLGESFGWLRKGSHLGSDAGEGSLVMPVTYAMKSATALNIFGAEHSPDGSALSTYVQSFHLMPRIV